MFAKITLPLVMIIATGLGAAVVSEPGKLAVGAAAGATTTTLASSLNPSRSGQSVTFAATVSPSTATGTVTFYHGSTEMGSGTLDEAGVATFATSKLSVGAHTITATYNGDTEDEPSTSAPLTQLVGKAQAVTTTTLTTSPNPSTVGESVTLTATVTPSTATGTVTFYHGSTSLGMSTLTAGVATLKVTTLTKGVHSLTATYGGDSKDQSSTSPAVDQVVE
jgi:uncharacterized protein YjdB